MIDMINQKKRKQILHPPTPPQPQKKNLDDSLIVNYFGSFYYKNDSIVFGLIIYCILSFNKMN